jgi:hypothetical protein
LFEEKGAEFILTVSDKRWDDLQDALVGHAYDWLGTIRGNRFRIGDLVNMSVEELKDAYERDLFGVPGEVLGGSEAVG